MERAAVYARVSRDKTGEHLAVERQIADCEQYANDRGYTLTHRATDNDISAYSGKRRPAYEDLLDRIGRGEFDVVLTWHTDRLHRNTMELERYMEVCIKANVRTETVKAGPLDLATPAGRFTARQLGALARYESEQKSERLKAKRRQARKAGIWQGGTVPFGWTIVKQEEQGKVIRHEAQINEPEAELVRWAYQALSEGRSLSLIVQKFQESGLVTRRGSNWRHSSVRWILTNPKYTGHEVMDGAWTRSPLPAIISESTYRRAQAVLSDPKRKTYDDNRTKYLLSGIARCHCGHRMAVRTVKGKLYYICNSGSKKETRDRSIKHASIPVELADQEVSERWPYAVRASESGLRFMAQAEDNNGPDLEAELEQLRKDQQDIMTMFASKQITLDQLQIFNEKNKSRIDEIENELSKTQIGELNFGWELLHPSQIAAYWDERDLFGRRDLLRQSVEITMHPTNGRHFRKLMEAEEAWHYLRMEPLPIEQAPEKVIYWKPTIEPIWDEWDDLPWEEPVNWPPFPLPGHESGQ